MDNTLTIFFTSLAAIIADKRTPTEKHHWIVEHMKQQDLDLQALGDIVFMFMSDDAGVYPVTISSHKPD